MNSFVQCIASYPRPIVSTVPKKRGLGPLPSSLLTQIIKRTVTTIAGPTTHLIYTPRS
jgi:hypothetical protein